MKEDTKQNCEECGHENPKNFMGKDYISHAPNCSLDTNTLREEIIKELNDKVPGLMLSQRQVIADFFINKFNQKLEEIEKEIEEGRNKEDGFGISLSEDWFNSGLDLALQIIKNKKI